MDFKTFSNNLKVIKSQRNYALCLNFFFAGLILVLLIINFIRSNQHTTIVVPATLSSPVTVTQNSVDEAYLKQWTEFIASLKLNITPDQIAFKQKNLLSYIAADQYGKFKEHLITEQEEVVKDEISMAFYPIESKIIDSKNLVTEISGVLKVYIGSELNQSAKVTYQLEFKLDNGKLLLINFKEVSRE